MMTSAFIRDALARSPFPDAEWMHIPEAPQDAQRQGRKIDLLIIGMWASRGHERIGVEIKVSMSDWRRERDHAEKADWWWQHTHRFYLACPTAMAEKVRAELPPTWGLLAVAEDGTVATVVRVPSRPDAVELPAKAVIGLLRAAQDAGPNALARAKADGYRDGHAAAEKAHQAKAERSTTFVTDVDYRKKYIDLVRTLDGLSTYQVDQLVRDAQILGRFRAVFGGVLAMNEHLGEDGVLRLILDGAARQLTDMAARFTDAAGLLDVATVGESAA